MKLKCLKANKITPGIALLFLFASFNAAALECYSGTVVDEGEGIGKLVLLSGTPNGSKVWESKEYVRDITCTTRINENVYFYPFPKIRSQPVPKGVKMGLIYNGKDLGTFNENSGGGNRTTAIDTGWNLNRTTATRTFRIKAYLVKTGEIDTSMSVEKIHLFQLDGRNGLNNGANARNYKFSLSQWNQTGMVNCSSSFSGMSFAVPSVETDKAFSDTSRHNITTPTLSISCNSDTAGLANLLTSVTGSFSVSGNQMKNANDYFATDREYFGFNVAHDGTVMTPGKEVPLTLTLSGGKANKSLPLTLSPRIMELKFNSPSWLFIDAEKEVKSKITPVFIPLSVNTN